MPAPVDDWITERASAVAGWLAAMFTGAFAVWKARLKVRSDMRQDGSAETVHGGFNEIVEQLRGEVRRLATTVSAMSSEIATERAARRDAEERALEAERRAREATQKAEALSRRVEALEHEIKWLRGMQ